MKTNNPEVWWMLAIMATMLPGCKKQLASCKLLTDYSLFGSFVFWSSTKRHIVLNMDLIFYQELLIHPRTKPKTIYN